MIWLSRILTFLLGFCSLWGVFFLVITTYGWEKVWYSIHGPADLGAVEFAELSKSSKPDQVLICPQLICETGNRGTESPIYDTDVDTLRTAFLKMLEPETSLYRVDDGSDPMRFRYVQRSRLLRLPDTISVQLISLDNGAASSLALYGRSQVDIPYLKQNIKRANRWFGRLKDLEK
ncbi:MAG: hypothetical protein GKR97_19955 [Rhizobiaceae bacterium]|nr:hypothetical protein [Rhizobiaceae bacterium]